MGTLFCQVTKPSLLISATSAKNNSAASAKKNFANIFRKISQTSFEKFPTRCVGQLRKNASRTKDSGPPSRFWKTAECSRCGSMQSLFIPTANAGGPDHRRVTSFPVTSTIDPPLLMSARTLNGGEVRFPVKFSMFVPLRNTH